MSQPKISVVIPTYNRREVLSRTLPVILNQDISAEDYEVVVVIDGSTDGTVHMLRSLETRCPLRIIEQANRGPAGARNTGLRAALGGIVLFLDDDILCGPSLLRDHLASHDGADTLCVYGPIVPAVENDPRSPRAGSQKSRSDEVQRLAPQSDPPLPHGEDAWATPNFSAPRSLLLAAGGYDERFGCSREDLDLVLRLRKTGAKFRFQPSAVGAHLCIKSDREVVREAARRPRSEILLCRTHPQYRPYSLLARLAGGPVWNYRFRQATARLPVSPELLLRVPYRAATWMGTTPGATSLAAGLHSARCAITFWRAARQEAGSWEALRGEFGVRLPVLTYHHVGPERPGSRLGLTISPQQFERQVRWLARRGYVGIRPGDWLDWYREGKPLPPHPVLLTFDDAYAHLADHALPVLRRYGFSAAVFVVTGHVGGTNAWDEARGSATYRLMTAEQIRHWAAQGIEFGAHGRTHADLTTLSGKELEQEVIGSRDDLATLVQQPVTSFAYPYGFQNEAVRACVGRAFALAFGIEDGLNTLRTQPCLLRRTMVKPGDSLLAFAFRAHWGWNPFEQARARIGLRSRLKAGMRLVFGGSLR